MNPALRQRIAEGGFARVTLDGDDTFTGYIARDPAAPERLRMDGCLLGPTGHLEQVSLKIEFDDIRHIQFLPQAPEFIDVEGSSFQMPRGFFPNLD